MILSDLDKFCHFFFFAQIHYIYIRGTLKREGGGADSTIIKFLPQFPMPIICLFCNKGRGGGALKGKGDKHPLVQTPIHLTKVGIEREKKHVEK